MTKDHKIRILVGGLRGKERDEAIMKLLSCPDLITTGLSQRLSLLERKGKR